MKNFLKNQKSNLDDTNFEILTELQNLLQKINNEKKVISPKRFINNINNKFSFEHEQQDSYELYHRLLEFFDTHNNNIKNPFSILIKNIFKCKTCSNTIEKIEETLDLSVTPNGRTRDIEDMLKKISEPVEIADYTCVKCSLKKLISQVERSLSSGEFVTQNLKVLSYLNRSIEGNIKDDLDILLTNLEDYCNNQNCSEALNNKDFRGVKSNLIKKTLIHELPEILTIHVQKVFFQEDSITTNKIRIIFPEELIFGRKRYQLTSFIEHWGVHSFGHYVAFRKFYSKWWKINDHRVTLIEREEALRVGDPYMLFYRKVEDII